MEKIRNGDQFIDFFTYECNRCGCKVPECDPKYSDSREILCWECAFRTGVINSDTFVKHCGMLLEGVKAGISPLNNEIEITNNKHFSWETPDKQQRNSNEYIKWRISVYERDNFTCQVCGQVGGNLNAHHIKSFAKYKRLRTDISNGITLCEKCHRKVHKGAMQFE